MANPKSVDCLRSSSYQEPRARATVIRGRLNDTLILDLDGIKPGLAFDLFTVQRSSLLAEGTPDPAFKGSFGLAWYQSDIQIGRHTDDGDVRIKTILLDKIFGFDPDAALPPTNTFHLGFWFNNPQDAATCGFPANDLTKFTPFNGEHKAGPLAMISVPDDRTKLGPLCTDPDHSKPGTAIPNLFWSRRAGEQFAPALRNDHRLRKTRRNGSTSGQQSGHLNLRVGDLDRVTDFYRDVLGLPRCNNNRRSTLRLAQAKRRRGYPSGFALGSHLNSNT